MNLNYQLDFFTITTFANHVGQSRGSMKLAANSLSISSLIALFFFSQKVLFFVLLVWLLRQHLDDAPSHLDLYPASNQRRMQTHLHSYSAK